MPPVFYYLVTNLLIHRKKSVSLPTEPDSVNDENKYLQRHSQRDMKVFQLFKKYVYNKVLAEVWKHRSARGKIKVRLFLTKQS